MAARNQTGSAIIVPAPVARLDEDERMSPLQRAHSYGSRGPKGLFIVAPGYDEVHLWRIVRLSVVDSSLTREVDRVVFP